MESSLTVCRLKASSPPLPLPPLRSHPWRDRRTLRRDSCSGADGGKLGGNNDAALPAIRL
jgi:hypothetical protein